MPTGTEDLNISRSYENNLNIDQEEDEVKLKPAKLTFQTPKGSATFSKPLVSPKVTVCKVQYNRVTNSLLLQREFSQRCSDWVS